MINKVILIGYIGKDPDVKHTSGGLTITNVSLATSSSRKDKNTGENVTETEWHNITFFGKQADFVAEYLQKGALVYVEGKLNTQKYQDKNTGQDRYSTKILAEKVQSLSQKPKDESAKPVTKDSTFIDDDIPF